MENTAYITLSRQATLRREMAVIANNLANMNTSGFKGEKMMFVEHLMRSPSDNAIMGDKLAYVRDVATLRDFSEGPMQSTGNPLDLALHGEGFFTIDTPEGTRYSRSGRFQLDATGQLVTMRGDPVLSTNGQPFFFSPGDSEINVSKDGTVSTENGTMGQLGVVTFENSQNLREVAGGLYTTDEAPTPTQTPHVVQYMTEGSNVKPIIEMTRMIEVSRSYQSVKNFMDKEDQRIKNMFDEVTKPI